MGFAGDSAEESVVAGVMESAAEEVRVREELGGPFQGGQRAPAAGSHPLMADACYVFGLVLQGGGGVVEPVDPEARDRPLWLHIDYSQANSEAWLGRLGIPANVVESMLRQDTRPRSMSTDKGTLVILRCVNVNPGHEPDDMVSLRVWLEKQRLITVRQRPVGAVHELRRELEAGTGPQDIQALMACLIERSTDGIADMVDALEAELDDHEEALEHLSAESLSGRLSDLRREVARLRRFLAPQRDALDSFGRQARSLFSAEQAWLVHEQADRLVRYVEDLDLVRERVLLLQDELQNKVAQEQNTRTYALSLVAAIFLPITFVTGLFGMNVAGLPGMNEPGAFWMLTLGLAVTAAAILLLFRSRRWL